MYTRKNSLKGINLFYILFFLFTFTDQAKSQEITIQDIFGRTLNEREIQVVDWEGQVANPVIELTIIPPEDVSYPATAILTANNARLYFDSPDDPIFSSISQVGELGPTRIVDFPNSDPRSFQISIFPDRDTFDESYELFIDFMDNNDQIISESINIKVIDQDQNRTSSFNIVLDFNQDDTGFFSDPVFGQHRRDVAKQAADDWAYFVDEMNPDQVDAFSESTFIFDPEGMFMSGAFVENTFSYIGFLLYMYGVNSPSPPFRSGGAPSLHALQTSSNGTIVLPLRRSGTVEIEVKGNFNTLGWFLTNSENDWWMSANLGDEINDLYSIAHHEIGHALFANTGYPNFENAENSCACFDNANIRSYHGTDVMVDEFDHFIGEIDDASLRGAYGYEYFGKVPARRWLITKLDLLILEAVGYQLRDTSPFEPLSIITTKLPDAVVNTESQSSLATASVFYSQKILVSGGIPFYNWTIVDGALPNGLGLDPFTGEISGFPTKTGIYSFTVNVRDYSKKGIGINQTLAISVVQGEPEPTPSPLPTVTPTPTVTPPDMPTGDQSGSGCSISASMQEGNQLANSFIPLLSPSLFIGLRKIRRKLNRQL
jgi:hypothetical protein